MIKKIRYTNHVTGEVRISEYYDNGSIYVIGNRDICLCDLTVGEMLDFINLFDGGIVDRTQDGLYNWHLNNKDNEWTVEELL